MRISGHFAVPCIHARAQDMHHASNWQLVSSTVFLGLARHEFKQPAAVQGYPSIGDAHSTVPVPKEKWYDYAGERSGRFQVGHPMICKTHGVLDNLCTAFGMDLREGCRVHEALHML